MRNIGKVLTIIVLMMIACLGTTRVARAHANVTFNLTFQATNGGTISATYVTD
ncbi:MAG: hypothetical protein ACLQO7_10505 [Candidatus Bathyarchaeia archaeon]